jgi:chloramphenicol 3-O phosphotransferase
VFHAVLQLAHESWAAMSRSGIDLIVDHCIFDAKVREQAKSALTDAFWVEVTCDVDELLRRESARGDLYIGFASGTSAVVHDEIAYDLVIDTTTTPSDALARQVYDVVLGQEKLS